jgi:hypothetical protein
MSHHTEMTNVWNVDNLTIVRDQYTRYTGTKASHYTPHNAQLKTGKRKKRKHAFDVRKILSFWCWKHPLPSSPKCNTYQVEPETPARYVMTSNRPCFFISLRTPRQAKCALRPPPEPRTAMTGAWALQRGQLEVQSQGIGLGTTWMPKLSLGQGNVSPMWLL